MDNRRDERLGELLVAKRHQRLSRINTHGRVQPFSLQLFGNVLVQRSKICARGAGRIHVRGRIRTGRKMRQLTGAVLRQTKYRQCPSPENTHQVDEILGSIAQLQQHTVARLHPGGGDTGRSGAASSLQLSIRVTNLLRLTVLQVRVRKRHQGREMRFSPARIQQKLGDGLINPVPGLAVSGGELLRDQRGYPQIATF